MDPLSVQFLMACKLFVSFRQPLIDDLASMHDVPPQDLFYLWMERKCPPRGLLPGGVWSYYFHGYECDLRNVAEGCFLRFDFAPEGATNGFTAWGVTQFVMTTNPPWLEFSLLQVHLAEKPHPFNELSGNVQRAVKLCEELEKMGLVSVTAPQLIELGRQFTTMDSQGIAVLRLPDDTPERIWFDVSVANRKLITPEGLSFLGKLGWA